MHEAAEERVPKWPQLSLDTFRWRRESAPCVLDVGPSIRVPLGQTAIALALQAANVQQNDEVLLPAYHCLSMVDPVLFCGAKPLFYRIDRDTNVDFQSLAEELSPRTKAVIACHYFGFPQKIMELRRFCDTHNLVMIEDCSHAFFGRHGEEVVGSGGDYAAASAWKFFPIGVGGYLVSARRSIPNFGSEPWGAAREIKLIVNVLESAFAYGRLPFLHLLLKFPFWLKDRILAAGKGITAARVSGDAQLDPVSHSRSSFKPELLRRKGPNFAEWVVRSASRKRICEQRRANYMKIQAGIADLPGLRPLFRDLPLGVVPQVYPIVASRPAITFRELKSRGVPVLRFGEFLWDGMPSDFCRVSEEYSRCVFQFPCHDGLRDDEIEWMIEQIYEVFSNADRNG